MTSRASIFNLNDQKIFKIIKEGLPETITKTQNILECKDDVIYVWNSAENCILTLNIKSFETDEDITYQTLIGTESINFSVDRLLVNELSSLICTSGSRGICVFRVPRRSGPRALFQGGKDTVICKSLILDERFFMSKSEVYQVSWHPGSLSDSHLLVLASDNTFRLYDVSSEEQPLLRSWACGRRAAGPLLPAAALGEAAVAFAPAPARPEAQPFLLLRGNGDVCMMDVSIDAEKSPSPPLIGPLSMYPPADDNYGAESCSILVLGRLVCIATCGGTLYHCILLPLEQDNERSQSMNHSTSSQQNYCLYVIEAIELDLGLSLSDSDPSHTCPIYLTADGGVKNRYFCTHETGVHIITVPIVNQLETFFNGSDDDIETLLPSLNQSSTAEYAICTKTARMNQVNPVLGVGLTYNPHALFTLLADGQLVTRELASAGISDMLFSDSLQASKTFKMRHNRSELTASLSEMQKVPFDTYIQQMLKHEVSQPILKMAKQSEPQAQECFELLTHATHVLRSEFTKLERARKEIEKRVQILRLIKKHQLEELGEWQGERQLVDSEALRLLQRCKESWDAQHLLNKRCEKVLRALRQKQSAPSIAEKEMSNEVKHAENKSIRFKKEMDKMKQKQKYQEIQMKNWYDDRSKTEVILGQNHKDIIHSTLDQHNNLIKEIIQDINTLKMSLNLS